MPEPRTQPRAGRDPNREVFGKRPPCRAVFGRPRLTALEEAEPLGGGGRKGDRCWTGGGNGSERKRHATGRFVAGRLPAEVTGDRV